MSSNNITWIPIAETNDEWSVRVTGLVSKNVKRVELHCDTGLYKIRNLDGSITICHCRTVRVDIQRKNEKSTSSSE